MKLIKLSAIKATLEEEVCLKKQVCFLVKKSKMKCVNISTVLLIKTGNILVYNINNIDFLGVTFSNVTWTISIQENAEKVYGFDEN